MLHTEEIWLTSDLHFFHKNVLNYCSRPYSSVEEMNETLIRNWNEVVSPGGIIFILGDLFFCGKEEAIKITKRLNGQKYWIFGNHDAKSRKWKELTSLFVWIGDTKTIQVYDPEGEYRQRTPNPPKKRWNSIRLFHEPIHSWAGIQHDAFHCHGHQHGFGQKTTSKILDVGVDAHNYYPISYKEVKKFMKTRTFTPVDGHGRKQ